MRGRARALALKCMCTRPIAFSNYLSLSGEATASGQTLLRADMADVFSLDMQDGLPEDDPEVRSDEEDADDEVGGSYRRLVVHGAAYRDRMCKKDDGRSVARLAGGAVMCRLHAVKSRNLTAKIEVLTFITARG